MHERTTRIDYEHDREHELAEERLAHRRAVSLEALYSVVRVVYLVFGVLEVLVLIRFLMKLANANTTNQVIAALYGITEPLVRPFFGIFPNPPRGPFIEIAALLALAFLVLVEALIIALVRAVWPRPR